MAAPQFCPSVSEHVSLLFILSPAGLIPLSLRFQSDGILQVERRQMNIHTHRMPVREKGEHGSYVILRNNSLGCPWEDAPLCTSGCRNQTSGRR